jgi:glyoxylase-like metal-dependent hydrolase (beta-lactamase superfamily II)
VIQVETVAGPNQIVKLRMARSLLGRTAYFTAAYWVDGLLIDTGCAHTARQLMAVVKAWRITQIVNTHSHEDHIGANADLQAACGCPILAHPDALSILANPKLQPLQPYRKLFWGWPKPSQGQPIGAEVETEHLHFQVIHTPGHSPDHVCLFEQERGWLFSGDTYIGGKDRALREGYDIYEIIASLKKLAALPVQAILAGSGSVRTEGITPLQDKIAYLEELGEQIRTLHNQGLSPRRIRRQLFGDELPIAYVTLGHFSGSRLIQSYLSREQEPHLDKEATL